MAWPSGALVDRRTFLGRCTFLPRLPPSTIGTGAQSGPDGRPSWTKIPGPLFGPSPALIGDHFKMYISAVFHLITMNAPPTVCVILAHLLIPLLIL